jgi:hypothetical protein
MAFNLANERIQDTYEQLVQISGSTLVNGIGTAIPAITNINSVSSSYAITASYAEYAVSASHEIVHEVSSSYAETASFANFATSAGTATTATTATTASHALYALTASVALNATVPTLQEVTDEGNGITGSIYIQTSSTAIGLEVNNGFDGVGPFTRRSSQITPQGFRTFSGETTKIQIGSSTRADYISSSLFNVSEQSLGPYDYAKWTTGEDGVLIYDKFNSATATLGVLSAIPNDVIPIPQVYINPRLNVDGQITASGNILMTNPNGNQTLTFTGSQEMILRGAPDFGTTFDRGGLIGADYISCYQIEFDPTEDGSGGLSKSILFINNRLEIRGATQGVGIYGNGTDSATSTVFIIGKNNQAARFKDASVELLQPVTASIISASSGFIGNASGLSEVPQLGQTAFFGKTDYLFDLPGDTNADPYNLHISQSGTYFVSCSGVPAGVAGPRVNIYYWPELLEIGTTAKVKFAIAKGDTLAGVTYKTNITGSSTSEWYWNSPTTSPAAEASRTITRTVAFANIGIGIGSTTMVKDGDGRVFFINSNTAIVSNNYRYTGDSLNPLI